MNISKKDKLEALKWIPRFQDDCNKWKQLRDTVIQCIESMDDDELMGAYAESTHLTLRGDALPGDDGPRKTKAHEAHEKAVSELIAYEKVIRERWGLAGPITPFDVINPLVDVISPLAASKQTRIGEIYEGYDPVRLSSGDALSLRYTYDGGKHLCMVVDLTKTKTELVIEFEENIKRYQDLIPVLGKKGRNKPTTSINIWQVYSMYHEDKKNLNQIAQELSGIKDNPAYNSRLMAWYIKVARAYKKANRIVTALNT